MNKTLLMLAIFGTAAFGLVGCESEPDTPGEHVEEMGEDIGEAMDEAGDNMEDAADELNN